MFGKLMHYLRHEDVNVLVGKTLTEIKNEDNYGLLFCTDNNEFYKMYHEQECCEDVSIEEIIGDLNDLIGSPITMAEEVIQDGDANDYMSQTWTFYKFATNKGYVTIRWLGESNGYYSESVDFCRVETEE